uniref:PAN domain protein n=1 Tax=Heterorhabditis bacteriophora TaxID=37862 RepID=A0A1I7X745_HETBA
MRLMEFPTYILKEGTLNTCVDACTSEANGHLCTSFEYDSRTQECSMHREDGQPFGPSVLTLAETPIAFFQQICVKADNLCSTPYAFERYPQSILIGHAMKIIKHIKDTSLHWVRTEEYSITHEKDVIIESMDMEECKAANLIATFQCVEASFEQIPNRKMDSEPYKSFDSQSVHECLSACLDDGQQCATAVYDYQEDTRLSIGKIFEIHEALVREESDETKRSTFTHPDQFTIAENVDYFDKICDVTSSPSNFERKAAKGTPNLYVGSTEEPLVLLKKSSSKGKVDGLESTSTVISATKPPKVSETDAEIEGTVIDDNEDFENTVNHQTVKARECLMLNINEKMFICFDCNNFILRAFFSNCYINHNFYLRRTRVKIQKDPNANTTWRTVCHYSTTGRGMLDGYSDLGFFINECIAERVGGLSPEPEPLKIIHEGCPDENVRNKLLRFPISQTSNGFSTKMKVFRFDGSRRVRIKCIIDVCIDHCPSVIVINSLD